MQFAATVVGAAIIGLIASSTLEVNAIPTVIATETAAIWGWWLGASSANTRPKS